MIKFQNVHKTYKNSGVDALRGVSFLIDEGEFVFIIGKSGSGKSTILKCMNCEERPNSGTISIDGFCISDMSRALVPVLRRHIGMIFQDFRLIETKTVAENISFAGEIIGLSRKSLHQKVQLVLNIVGLKDKSDAYPQQLSGGEQQRVAIARAMLNNPKIIIADEPTGNLDPETSENIMGLLLDINRSGTTVIVCTHDANMVDRMKKRVIEIENGLVVRDKEDSAYSDQEVNEASLSPAVPPVYVEKPPVGDFFFGDTPASAVTAKVTPVPATPPIPVVPAVPSAPIATAFGDEDSYDDEEVAFGDVITDVAKLPVENEEEEIAEVPVFPVEETKAPVIPQVTGPVAEPVEEVKEEPQVVREDPDGVIQTVEQSPEFMLPGEDPGKPFGEVSLEEIPVEEFPFEPDEPQISETSVEPEEEEVAPAPAPVAAPAPAPAPVKEDDDSWLEEVRLDDIDLDIQEDDE